MTSKYAPGTVVNVGSHPDLYRVESYDAGMCELTNLTYGTTAIADADLVRLADDETDPDAEVVVYDHDEVLITMHPADGSMVISYPAKGGYSRVPWGKIPARYVLTDHSKDGGRVYGLYELNQHFASADATAYQMHLDAGIGL